MRIVGLTGGIASGKSTVSNLFKSHGIPVVDADIVARNVLKKGTGGWKRVVAMFGEDILQDNGEVDRGKLGQIVFSDPAKRQLLNRLLAPYISSGIFLEVLKLWIKGCMIIVLDVPLLFEAKMDKWTKPIVFVWVDPETQLQRLMTRDRSTEEEAKSRINSQMSLDMKREKADIIIDNRGTLGALNEQFGLVLIQITKPLTWSEYALSRYSVIITNSSRMGGAVLIALVAAIGNLLQGWDNATIAGSVLYIKREFNLETQPTIEGLIVAMSLIGATFITTFSGPVSDSLGRRPMLIISSVLYFLSGLVMLWAPNVYVLLLARLLDGFGVGLAVTLVPVYISETAPPDIRGFLNTFPQFTGSVGMFLSYCMVFGMSLKDLPSWRLMLGVLSIPSLLYFLLTILYLPESPRWLVSKGKMKEAKKVLQKLRGREDVSGEMALLMEGLDVGGDISIEEYIIGPDNDLADTQEHASDNKNQETIKLYGAEEGLSWVAKPVTGQSTLGLVSRRGSMAAAAAQGSFVDPMVTLFGSVHEKLQEPTGSMRSMLFSNFGSMFNVAENKNEQWDEENAGEENHISDNDSGHESDDNNLRSPLLSRQGTNAGKDMETRQGSTLIMQGSEEVSGIGIGGGWQLAYKKDDRKEGALKRIYLHQEGGPGSRRGSIISLPGCDNSAEGEFIQAAALVSRSILGTEDIMGQKPIEEAMETKSKIANKGSAWNDLFEPGVKHALIVGVGLQILQQFSGINGVLYYTPQILKQAGVGLLLSKLGLGSDSASILISAATTLLMLPAIGIAMRLMDIAGRRWLLLYTLPVLLASLVTLVLGNIIHMSQVINAVISTISVVIYLCCFVMGFGPIPNILCAEIFPTRVRGQCIAICALTFWIGDIIVTYSLPLMLSSIGLRGVFGIYTIVCAIAWVFVFLKVPETKGMPLEVITEFFVVGAKQASE